MKKLLTILLMIVLSFNIQAQTNTFDEVCAALIFNISRYVEWGAISDDFEIVVINQPKIADNLKKYFSSRKINGATVKIIQDKNSRTDFSGVEMLISHKKIKQENLLTIDINETNGIVNLVEEDGKIKMKIRKSSVDQSGLKMSSSLTTMVEIIE